MVRHAESCARCVYAIWSGGNIADSTAIQTVGNPHSWKSFTAKECNRLLERSGTFWQEESYDHLIRNQADFRHAVKYLLDNPMKAGLKNWKWVGLTECGKRILSVRLVHGRDARATRHVRIAMLYSSTPARELSHNR